jgi:DNA polymerase III delta prime subunit
MATDSIQYPWCEKYRPSKTDDILCHTLLINALNNYLSDNKFPHIIMAGSSGVGKSTTIMAFAKKYYGEDYDNMTLILNASEERGIETVRSRVKQFVTTSGYSMNVNGDNPTYAFKLVILDEMDSMTATAQSILRKMIETYTVNVRFCFICNYLKKINPAIQSRCVIFKFKPICKQIMYDYAIQICRQENVAMSANALKLVVKYANGDLRKMLNALQSLNMTKNTAIYQLNDVQMQSGLSFDTDKLEKVDTGNTIVEPNKRFVICERHASKILSTPTQKLMLAILEFIQTNNLRDSIDFVYDLYATAEVTLLEMIYCLHDICMDYFISGTRTVLRYSEEKVVEIVKNMANIDTNLSNCNDENVQVKAFVAMFFL